MNVSDFDYDLPADRIPRYPLSNRADARMMVVKRATGEIDHLRVVDFPDVVGNEALVVLNDARVIPARLRTTSPPDGELLLLDQLSPTRWRALGRPSRKMPMGSIVEGNAFSARVVDAGDLGSRTVEFHEPPDLDGIGELPLPPYLGRRAEAIDTERYQTTFARTPGAVAAPTAGLHFTPDLLAQVHHAFITLYVGEGTFRDVKVDRVEDHAMHSERFVIPEATAHAFNTAQRCLAVGTTVARTLEAAVHDEGSLSPGAGETAIFIYPPFQFRAIDALLTNFHLPKSTLLMLVSAFAGMELTRSAYARALESHYRFFSYGDCMLII